MPCVPNELSIESNFMLRTYYMYQRYALMANFIQKVDTYVYPNKNAMKVIEELNLIQAYMELDGPEMETVNKMLPIFNPGDNKEFEIVLA
jgi:hypothetical protein